MWVGGGSGLLNICKEFEMVVNSWTWGLEYTQVLCFEERV